MSIFFKIASIVLYVVGIIAVLYCRKIMLDSDTKEHKLAKERMPLIIGFFRYILPIGILGFAINIYTTVQN